MGSLMSGWDSTALDPKSVKFRRNKSLTRDEIDAFWRTKKNEEEHNNGASSPVAGTTNQENIKKFRRSESLPLSHRRDNMMNNHEEARDSGVSSPVGNNQENKGRVSQMKKLQRSESMPTSGRRESVLNSASNQDDGKHILRQGWWTTCSSAFLNETPVVAMEGPAYKYASQYHYTRFSSAK